jgi:multiple sugar transport system permease protein
MTTLSTFPPSGQALKSPRKRSVQKRDWTGWKFIGPFMIVFALVLIAPVLYSIYLSFFKDQLVGGNSFVGFDNYGQALTDPKFWESMGRVTLFFVVQVPIMLGIALFAALAIDSARLHLSSFFRIAIFLPYAVPAVVATLMWGFMYGTKFGLVGNLNDFFDLAIPNPLGASWVLAAIGNIVTWEFIGYNMILFRIIRSIKMPALRPAIVIGGIFSVIGSFQLFNEPSILQSLAPNTISTYFSPNMYAYNLSFSGQQYNYSATIAIIVGLITAVIAYIVQNSGSRKEV